MNRIYCRYCGNFLYDSDTSSERFTVCKYAKPDCNIELTNFNRSLVNAENSDNDFLQYIADEIKGRLQTQYPKELKSLLRLTIRKKSPDRLFTTKKVKPELITVEKP
jgi:hypothetical protein